MDTPRKLTGGLIAREASRLVMLREPLNASTYPYEFIYGVTSMG
jgi:hypothetical protein